MKIHLLSDTHLKTGGYSLPSDLECDLIVAAGDIAVDAQEAVDWLKTLDKPVIYVAGNHEYWSKKNDKSDIFQIQRDIRKSTENSNVHFLENDSVVIDGVKFVGATLWTNLGSINYELSPGYMDEAAKFMRDSYISCFEFYQDEELSEAFHKLLDRYLHVSRQCDADARKEYALECEKEGIPEGTLHSRVILNEDLQKDLEVLLGKQVIVNGPLIGSMWHQANAEAIVICGDPLSTLNIFLEKKDEIKIVLEKYGAISLRISEYVARSEFAEINNVELLVYFGPGTTLLDVQDIEDEITAIVGKQVELGTGVSEASRDRVNSESILIC